LVGARAGAAALASRPGRRAGAILALLRPALALLVRVIAVHAVALGRLIGRRLPGCRTLVLGALALLRLPLLAARLGPSALRSLIVGRPGPLGRVGRARLLGRVRSALARLTLVALLALVVLRATLLLAIRAGRLAVVRAIATGHIAL